MLEIQIRTIKAAYVNKREQRTQQNDTKRDIGGCEEIELIIAKTEPMKLCRIWSTAPI